MKKAAVLSILFVVMLLAVAVVAEAQQPNKDPPDRLSSRCHARRSIGPHRGFPAGSDRAWLRGGEKHCH